MNRRDWNVIKKIKMDVSIWVSITGKLGERKEVLARREIAK